MGKRYKSRGGRDIQGILLLDKPYGVTSNSALQDVKQRFRAAKAGHTGSLDPIATGLLPLCFGEATKISSFFLNAGKHYETVLRLGLTTDTGDCAGQVLKTRDVAIDKSDIEQALTHFRGEIKQIPPMYSALKHQGQPLYKLARQGIEIERKPRDAHVYELSYSRFEHERLELNLKCSSGFYVRGLAHDLGEKLGCGAHVESLRRLGVGHFYIDDAVTTETIGKARELRDLDELLIPVDKGLSYLPEIKLSDDAAFYLCRGQAVKAADVPTSGWVRLYAKEAGFLGVGEVLEDGRVAPKRLFNTA